MGLIILKFGGTSMANIDLIRNAAKIIKKEIKLTLRNLFQEFLNQHQKLPIFQMLKLID